MLLQEGKRMTDFSEFQEHDELAELKAAHNRVLRTLAKKERQTEELVEAVYRAAKDAALGMKIAPVPAPKPQTPSKSITGVPCPTAKSSTAPTNATRPSSSP